MAALPISAHALLLDPWRAGYGVYGSMEECMASEAFVEGLGIDPSSYPAPTFPPTACPANARAAPVREGWAAQRAARMHAWAA